MNAIKKVFARFLIVCWLGIIFGLIVSMFNGSINDMQVAGGFGLFTLAVQFVFFGILNPLKLIEVGVINN